jgi:hypothetical protein
MEAVIMIYVIIKFVKSIFQKLLNINTIRQPQSHFNLLYNLVIVINLTHSDQNTGKQYFDLTIEKLIETTEICSS